MSKIIILAIFLQSCYIQKPTQMTFIVTKIVKVQEGYNIYLRRYHSLYSTFATKIPDSVKVGAKINIAPLIKIN